MNNFTKQLLGVQITLLLQSFFSWINNDPLFLLLTFLVITVCWVLILVWTKWLKPKSPSIHEPETFGPHRKGIIFTLGRASHKKNSATLKALENQQPQFYGFLGTSQTFQENAVGQIVDLAKLNRNNSKEEINDPLNMEATRAATIKMIQWMSEKGLNPADIVVDVTGGMVPMSLGAYMGANEMGVDVQYIASKYGDDNKPINGSQRALLVKM